jgi:hypothetical protein
MPTDAELGGGWPEGIPVMVVHRKGHEDDELKYRSDLWSFTIDPDIAPLDDAGIRASARFILYQAVEQFTNYADDLQELAAAIVDSPRKVALIEQRLRHDRVDEHDAFAALERERSGTEGNHGD